MISTRPISLTILCLFASFLFGCMRYDAPPPLLNVKETPAVATPTQPMPAATVALKKKVQRKMVIVLDAGHGGDDFGTHSLGKPTYHEKTLNLTTTNYVKAYLQQAGYQVIMTRSDDSFIALEERAKLANAQKPDLFVSIHYNSAPSKEAEGIEVFYYRDDESAARVAKSKKLAQAILNRTLKNTQAKSRGVKHGNFAVIRETNMPAVLIEGGFLSNAGEMEKIKTTAYQKIIALGIAQGIQDYTEKD